MVGGDGIGVVADDGAAAKQRVLAVMFGRNLRLQPFEGGEIRRHLAPLPRLSFGAGGGVGLRVVVGVRVHMLLPWSGGRGGVRGGRKQGLKQSLMQSPKQDDGGRAMMRTRRHGAPVPSCYRVNPTRRGFRL